MTINTRAEVHSQETAPKRREEEDISLSWMKGCDVEI